MKFATFGLGVWGGTSGRIFAGISKAFGIGFRAACALKSMRLRILVGVTQGTYECVTLHNLIVYLGSTLV